MARKLWRLLTGPWRRRRFDAVQRLRQQNHLLAAQLDYFRKAHRIARLEAVGLGTMIDAIREWAVSGAVELPPDLLDRFLARAEKAGLAPQGERTA